MANGGEEDEKPGKSVVAKKEGMLKELQDLREMLEQLYHKNVKLDEENISLKKEVREMKRQISSVIDVMRALREDLKKAHEVLIKPRKASRVELTPSASV